MTDGNDEVKVALSYKILNEFCLIQSSVITREITRTKKLRHKAGDFKRDNRGNPIERFDKSGYETYKKDEVETVEVQEEVPYYDFSNYPSAYNELKKWLANVSIYSPIFSETTPVSLYFFHSS